MPSSWLREMMSRKLDALADEAANDNFDIVARAYEAWFEPWFCDEPVVVTISGNVLALVRPSVEHL